MAVMKRKLWVPGDWSAFFGFGTNMLVNLLTLTALLRFVLKMPDLVGKMKDQGVLDDALRVLGGGSILGGLILGAIAVFIIDRDFMKASAFALAGALLTFFGFMGGEQIGMAQTPTVAASYLLTAGIFVACARFAVMTDRSVERVTEPHGEGMPAQA